jgi:putative transposase
MKPNTYSKLYVHCVFTPKGRESVLSDSLQIMIQKYIYGTIVGLKCFPIAINGTHDHIHILTGFTPKTCIEYLVRDIKRSSSLYINSNHLLPFKFNWQEGYSAFTVGYRDLDRVFKYVSNQKIHHSQQNFRDEYKQILTEEGIEFKTEHLYEFYD